ncbi:MAG: FAD-dependent oxidoreductase, partial [Proteobacteria bacterium]|nr:FAD-dependent oxidoreductase [Pseudomonadota bacterium]MBU1740927.1 FAD-dependent oxidoreductase [Pseudomonadota bacterium]
MEQDTIRFTIDGREAAVAYGTTVLEAARRLEIWIPTLCDNDALEPYGACRLCLVEIEVGGRRRLTASCAYPVAEGLKVSTRTERVLASRRLVAELLLARCGQNEPVRELCAKLGVTDTPFPTREEDCVLCGQCVRMCSERMRIGAISFMGRGESRKVGSPFGDLSETCLTCGTCESICPTGAITAKSSSGREPILLGKEFNENLNWRSNIDIPFPSAVPLVPNLRRDNCIHFQVGDDACGICQATCPAEAIDLDQTDRETEVEVGAIVAGPGLDRYDPRVRGELGFGRYKNVVTSIQFERILSASGPYRGEVQRPGDGRHPHKVAWLQCVGSRDRNNANPWCSSVCCMYATKQAVIAQDHVSGLETAIFYMDVRAYGKGFDRYYERAKNEHGVRYVRSMISRIVEDPASGDLEVQYFDDADELRQETFDLVVLSVGLVPREGTRDLARILGVDTDSHLFSGRTGLNPLRTSQEGIFACGTWLGPQDIPDTVVGASGAAAHAGELLAEVRGTEITPAVFPEERDVSAEAPRIGVFVCHCGINIGGVVDVPGVIEYALGLPQVQYADEYLFTCSTDAGDKMIEAIRKNDLNRVVVASCSPRTHEPMFRERLRHAGLNPYLFEMANIRDQCSWVHQADHDRATDKARDLVRMSVARATLLEPLRQFPVPVDQTALVIGGGVAGMTAALSLAEQGFYTHLVEKDGRLGGFALGLGRSVEGFDIQGYVRGLIDQVTHHGNIQVYLETEVEQTGGHVGSFVTRIKTGDKTENLSHGAALIATGAQEYRPEEYDCGRDDRVLTQLDLHQALHGLGGDGDPLVGVGDVVMIQCVGSRTEDNPYCSRICCSQAVGNALRIKELKPDCEVTILFRDMRTYSLKELFYQEARDKGVRFIRFDPDLPPQVDSGPDGLSVKVFDQILREWIALPADRLALAAAVRPRDDQKVLASRLKLPLDADGFFMEAHLKLRPVDFVAAGFFMAGTAHGPKFIEEVISQAKAAASRAATILAQKELMVGGEVAVVDAEKCVACLTCVRSCPYSVPRVNEEGVVDIDPAACHGCGICASQCPRKLIQVQHHTDAQIVAKAVEF